MCTAATYKTKDFYFGRTLDYEFSYDDEITVTPRNYPFEFRYMGRTAQNPCQISVAAGGEHQLAELSICCPRTREISGNNLAFLSFFLHFAKNLCCFM